MSNESNRIAVAGLRRGFNHKNVQNHFFDGNGLYRLHYLHRSFTYKKNNVFLDPTKDILGSLFSMSVANMNLVFIIF